MHLKERTYAELAEELRRAGFVGLCSPWRNGRLHRLPLLPVAAKVAAGRAVAAGPSRRVRRALATVLGTAACSVVAVRP